MGDTQLGTSVALTLRTAQPFAMKEMGAAQPAADRCAAAPRDRLSVLLLSSRA
ncbi:hypothetical protein ACIBVL_43010 [Streptomyces sp. NPDC049687]|uniref:hypothetical protein n=1 Tax=Streptomyces sp. NPDC049687 TaxID=3365596 RepID=UPI0037A2C490